MRMVSLDKLILKKTLSRFLEIHLQIAEICVTKTCLEHVIITEKYGSKIPSNISILDTCVKNEQG
jgi:hypothetical protein